MDAYIFDGKKEAEEIESSLKKEVRILKKKKVVPKLVSLIIGKKSSGRFYQRMKQRAAKKIGALIEVRVVSANTTSVEIIEIISKLNKDNNVHGVMVQLPFPENYSKKDKDKIISSISFDKDIDGMRDKSPFLTPVVKAVIIALRQAAEFINKPPAVLVVGFRGFEGNKIYQTLRQIDYDVKGIDRETSPLTSRTKKADVLISTTGITNLISAGMVKKGAVVIDVGSPKGDVNFDKVVQKTSFITPVPGGIGPVTVASLLQNLVESANSSLKSS